MKMVEDKIRQNEKITELEARNTELKEEKAKLEDEIQKLREELTRNGQKEME